MPRDSRAPSSSPPLTRNDWTVLVATLLYVAPALAVSLQRGNGEFVMYAAVLVVLMVAALLVHRQVRFHPLTLWGLWLWGLAHMLGGLLAIPRAWTVSEGASPVLYNWWILGGPVKFDQLVHACGFGLTTWMCWQGLRRAFENRGVQAAPTLGLLTLCVAAGTGFGALNEVVEFTATLLMPETNVGGYENTGWDLVSNLLGSVAAAGLIRLGGITPAARRERSVEAEAVEG